MCEEKEDLPVWQHNALLFQDFCSDSWYTHWLMMSPFSHSSSFLFSLQSGLINSMCGYNVQNISSVVEVNKYIYTRGCVEALTEFIERNMNLVAGVCLGSALIQLLAMFLARSLQGQIMSQRARWMWIRVDSWCLFLFFVWLSEWLQYDSNKNIFFSSCVP